MSGNCGVGFAPVRPGREQWLIELMEGVEDIPGSALAEGMTWGWESFADYLGCLEGRIAVNAGFLVGHCAIRRYVMGPDAVGGQPTPDQLDAMVKVLHESLAAGGLGFSTTLSHTHSDGDGQPVASRWAKPDELVALCQATGEHEGTTLEGIVPGCLDMVNFYAPKAFPPNSRAARSTITARKPRSCVRRRKSAPSSAASSRKK